MSLNDEQITPVTEHWPRFITLEAKLSDTQIKPLTKVSAFVIQKGLQGIIGTKISQKIEIWSSTFRSLQKTTLYNPTEFGRSC